MPDQKNLSVRTDPEFAKKTGPRGWRTQDELLVPIRGSSGNMLGFISVDDPRDWPSPRCRRSRIAGSICGAGWFDY